MNHKVCGAPGSFPARVNSRARGYVDHCSSNIDVPIVHAFDENVTMAFQSAAATHRTPSRLVRLSSQGTTCRFEHWRPPSVAYINFPDIALRSAFDTGFHVEEILKGTSKNRSVSDALAMPPCFVVSARLCRRHQWLFFGLLTLGSVRSGRTPSVTQRQLVPESSSGGCCRRGSEARS